MVGTGGPFLFFFFFFFFFFLFIYSGVGGSRLGKESVIAVLNNTIGSNHVQMK